jgi:hypothetical protein
MDVGISASLGKPIVNALPTSLLGIAATTTAAAPSWATIGILTPMQIQNLQAQIGYSQSGWNYGLIGTGNALGRYQFTPAQLESYGLIALGSNTAYGTDCVNYRHCWRPTYVNKGLNVYENYFYNITSLNGFLTTTVAQDHLAYQYLNDLYVSATNAGAIKKDDTADVVAGMLYVCWILGTGSQTSGDGAWAWRYNNIGAGSNVFNAGRYSVTVLSR